MSVVLHFSLVDLMPFLSLAFSELSLFSHGRFKASSVLPVHLIFPYECKHAPIFMPASLKKNLQPNLVPKLTQETFLL